METQQDRAASGERIAFNRDVKIRVQRQDGSIETLTLASGTWECVNGKLMSRLQYEGFEHFFTEDGYYDGWGGAVNASPEEADDILRAMETKRVVER